MSKILNMDLYERDMAREELSGVNLGYMIEAEPGETLEEYERRRREQFEDYLKRTLKEDS